MEKQKDPFNERFAYLTEIRGVFITKLSAQLGISKEKMFKWKNGDSVPRDYRERLIVEGWMDAINWEKFKPSDITEPEASVLPDKTPQELRFEEKMKEIEKKMQFFLRDLTKEVLLAAKEMMDKEEIAPAGSTNDPVSNH